MRALRVGQKGERETEERPLVDVREGVVVQRDEVQQLSLRHPCKRKSERASKRGESLCVSVREGEQEQKRESGS